MDSNKSILKWNDIEGERLNVKYTPNYLEEEIADQLLETLEKDVQYFSGELNKVKVFGKWREIRRQQVAFGDPGLTYKFSGLSLPALTWPQCLLDLRDKIHNDIGYFYNVVLINRYRNGYDYIAQHKDDESELDIDAGIVSISLGEVRDFVLRYTDDKTREKKKMLPIKIALAHGSLLHMLPPTNKYWHHSLPVRKTAMGVTINLTFRKVRVLSID